MKVALYIRVSTDEQVKEGYSIDAQKERLKAFAFAQDWDIYGLYIDEGISAKDTNRPELTRMLDDIKSGEIECVLVYRLDRLTRSVLDLYKLLELFEAHNCKFKSATEVYDTTTAIGRLFITLVAALAQWERENMGERIRMGYQEKTRQGRFASNNRPFGYNLDKKGNLTINEEESRVVREIFDLYLKGEGMNSICQTLNGKGIKTRAGNEWNQKGISHIIHNPVYMGTLRWNIKEENPIYVEDAIEEPIVSKEIFEQAVKLSDLKATTYTRSGYDTYIFSGVLRCPNCGRSMTGYYVQYKNGKGEVTNYKNYRCSAKKEGRCTKSSSLAEKKLETLFRNLFASVDADDIVKLYEKHEEEFKPDEAFNPELEIQRIKKELAAIKKRKKKWRMAWSNEDLTDEEFKDAMDDERDHERILQDELEMLTTTTAAAPSGNPIDVKSILKDLRENWDNMTDKEKKTLIQLTFSKLVVSRVGQEYTIEELELT